MSTGSAESAQQGDRCPFGAASAVDHASAVDDGFDPFAGAYHDDAATALAEARASRPVFYSPRIDHWVVTRYADVRKVLRDTESFSAANAMDPIVPLGRPALRTLVRHRFVGGPVLANEDEPIHRLRRRRLAAPFSASRLRRWEPGMRELVNEHIDRFAWRGHAELMAELLWPVPSFVVLSFMGVPAEQIAEAHEHSVSQAKFAWGRPTEDEQVRSADVLGRYWRFADRFVARLGGQRNAAGWIGHAVRAQRHNPELFNDTYLRSLVLNGSTAAHETTAGAAANTIRELLAHPESWHAVCADPGLIGNAVEEALRYRPAVISWRRQAIRSTTVSGVEIPDGASVLLVTASGNRDERAFPRADEFDIHRTDARRHLTFGSGNHVCLGAPLARLQVRVIVAELTRRLPELRLVAGQRFDHVPNTSFRTPEKLLVEWPVSSVRK